MHFLQDLKLKYYEMMIQYALKHSAYLDAAKYWYKVWETPSIKDEVDGRGRQVRQSIMLYRVSIDWSTGFGTYCLLCGLGATRQWTIRYAAPPIQRPCPRQTRSSLVCMDNINSMTLYWLFFKCSCKMLHNTRSHAMARYRRNIRPTAAQDQRVQLR